MSLDQIFNMFLSSLTYSMLNHFTGDYGSGETPDPISNSEVKSTCADDTALVTGWQSRTSPVFF